MKVVIAPDSFKESLDASLVARAIEEGIVEVNSDWICECVPMADGGEGTLACLVGATGGSVLTARVKGPDGESVEAKFGILGDGETAVIEMAEASGLSLVPESDRDVLSATSYGTGELIREALEKGCKKIIIGIGGSATNDGGVGALSALGVKFLDKESRELSPGGAPLSSLAHIDVSAIDSRIKEAEFLVACDVDNPLIGRGAEYNSY